MIVDLNGDALKVEAVYDEAWTQLIQLFQLYQSGGATWRWIGGNVEIYDNEWGFRFDPNTIFTAEYVAEIMQTSIRLISQNLGYWLENTACVRGYVVEAYGSPDVDGNGDVDIYDIAWVGLSYGYSVSEPGYPQVDLNYDFRVDVRDLFIVARHFGET